MLQAINYTLTPLTVFYLTYKTHDNQTKTTITNNSTIVQTAVHR